VAEPEDWYGEDLTGREWSGESFRELDLSETTSALGARFTECTFRHCRFNVSEHTGAAFDNCTFSNCNFFGASFTDCKFLGSRFERCTFDQLTVRGGDWSFVALPGADLRSAKFENTRMREIDLGGTRLAGAALRRCDLSGAQWAKANLDGCDLRGSDVSAIDPWSVSLAGTIITWDQAAVLASAMGLDIRAD
jgi:uncharacterized protein YjbI with pentapeptide repeats